MGSQARAPCRCCRWGCDGRAGMLPSLPPGPRVPSSAVGRAGGQKQAAESFSEARWHSAEDGRLHEASQRQQTPIQMTSGGWVTNQPHAPGQPSSAGPSSSRAAAGLTEDHTAMAGSTPNSAHPASPCPTHASTPQKIPAHPPTILQNPACHWVL